MVRKRISIRLAATIGAIIGGLLFGGAGFAWAASLSFEGDPNLGMANLALILLPFLVAVLVAVFAVAGVAGGVGVALLITGHRGSESKAALRTCLVLLAVLLVFFF